MPSAKKPKSGAFPCEKPKCGARTHIKHPVYEGAGIRRTRICNECGHKFQTIEVSAEAFNMKVHQRAIEIAADLKEVREVMDRRE